MKLFCDIGLGSIYSINQSILTDRNETVQIFKNKWFSKFAREEGILDKELCEAVLDANRGLIDADYGGGVIKQRIARPNEGKSGYDAYVQLVEESEMLQDVCDYDAVKTAINQGKEELVPGEVTFALLDGENPVKVWREYRCLTQQQLAEVAEISTPYLSQIETGKRTGTTEVLLAVAKALNVTLDDIVFQVE